MTFMHNGHRLLVVQRGVFIAALLVHLLTHSLLGADEVLSTESLPESVTYINASFPSGLWTFISGRKDGGIADTWQLGEDAETKAPILICKGEPHGYLRTLGNFTNFDMQLDWRFPKDPNGNSGILLFTSDEDRVWPASLQVQFHQPELGSTFPVGGAKCLNELKVSDKLAKPINQWNHCEIRCRAGTVTVVINGQLIGEVSGCSETSGAISLQSEGSEIHFRAISIREIPVAQLDDLSLNAKALDSVPATQR